MRTRELLVNMASYKPRDFYVVQDVLTGNSHPKETHLDYAYWE